MSASYPTKVLLAFRSGDRCAFSGCSKGMTVDAPTGGDSVVIGEAAHIAGENAAAARYDPNMSDIQRNQYENLIYMCGDHHTQIDKQVDHFPVSTLRQLKIQHESTVRAAMQMAFAEVGFTELQIATAWVNRFTPTVGLNDYSLLPPEDKIKKNELTNESRIIITMGLSVARVVGEFVQNEAQIDADYPEKLKAGFLQEYYRLRHEGAKGDELFDLMCAFAQQGLRTQAKRSAGLAVLVYLFETCDVFEK